MVLICLETLLKPKEDPTQVAVELLYFYLLKKPVTILHTTSYVLHKGIVIFYNKIFLPANNEPHS